MCEGVGIDHHNGTVIMFGPSYGQLTHWSEEGAHGWTKIGFPRARLIVEAQQHILRFLRNIVELLLEGIDIDGPGASDKWIEVTRVGFKQKESIEYWSPYINRPFSATPVLDVEHMVSIAKTRLEATGDHLWLPQTDPSYMRHFILMLSQGAFVENARSRRDAMVHISTELINQLLAHVRWQWIAEECENVQTQYMLCQHDIRPGGRLPKPYDQALDALELLIANQIIHSSNSLYAFMAQHPGFRHTYNFDHSITGAIRYERARRWITEEVFQKDPLDWYLSQLLGPLQNETSRIDSGVLFSFLEIHLSKASALERARIDQFFYDRLSDHAAINKIRQMVALNRPLSNNRHKDDVRETENYRRAWRYRGDNPMFAPRHNQETITKALTTFKALPLPSGKKDSSYLERTEQLHSVLSTFWSETRKGHGRSLEKANIGLDDIQFEMHLLSADTDPEHIKALEQEREEILAVITGASAARPSIHPGPVQM